MFGCGNYETRDMPDEERIARCISSATHGTSEYWRIYLPAAMAIRRNFYVDVQISGAPRSAGGLLG